MRKKLCMKPKSYFPDEQLFRVELREPWYTDIVNYLVCKTSTANKERGCFMNVDLIDRTSPSFTN